MVKGENSYLVLNSENGGYQVKTVDKQKLPKESLRYSVGRYKLKKIKKKTQTTKLPPPPPNQNTTHTFTH